MKNTIVYCKNCDKEIIKDSNYIKRSLKRNYNFYCSIECMNKNQRKNNRKGEIINCKQCGKETYKSLAEIKRSKNLFCGCSCATIYKNAHRNFSGSRSKLEIYIEQQLILLFPMLEFHFNRKDTIGSELDIYIPELKLAFEINGIFHYEPIFGLDKLNKTQFNDVNKFQSCQKQGISLCIINTSLMKYFKPDNAKEYLDVIINIVDDLRGQNGKI